MEKKEKRIQIISRFYGVVIKMYFQQSEHNPPHFHVLYQDYMGVFDIRTLQMIEGDLPSKAQALVREWGALHREALLRIWETQNFVKLPPLD